MMECTAGAIVFCFLMWKWPKKTIIGMCICAYIGIVALAVAIFINSLDHNKKIPIAALISALMIILPVIFFRKRSRLKMIFCRILSIERHN